MALALTALVAVGLMHATLAEALTKHQKADADLVKVDFFVMSKCPDARECENQFADAIGAVAAMIDLNLNYIANETSSGDFVCRHGPTECEGDKQQLCVKEHSDPAVEAARAQKGLRPTWYDFATCQSATQYNIPGNGEECAQSVGADWSVIETCVTGGEAAKLLHASIGHIIPKTNDTISCTVNLNDQFWCQHNDDWFGCTEGNTSEDLVLAVCRRYQGTKPDFCSGLLAADEKKVQLRKDSSAKQRDTISRPALIFER